MTNAPTSPRRSAITSIRVPVEEDADDGEPDDLEIEPEGPALDVLDVVLDALLERGVAAQAVDLGPTGDPRLHLVAEHVAGHGLAEPLDEDRPLRTRPHHAHLAAQHVDELGQLVEAEAPEEGAEPSAARVAGVGPHRARAPLGVGLHGAELQHVEGL